jgi:hypothetical protein
MARITEVVPPLHETLLVISLGNVAGEVVLQTVWATTPDRRAGHRRTDVERIVDITVLKRRLLELAPAICWDPAAPPLV